MKKSRKTRRCNLTLICLTLLLGIFLTASPGQGIDYNQVTKAFTLDGRAVITTTPLNVLAASEFNAALLNAGYPGWTVNSPTAAPGTFSVTSYQAGSLGSLGGANLEVTYDNGTALPPGQQLRWVQFTNTNAPPTGTSSPYIDPFPTDDNLPFYWTNDQLSSYAAGQTLKFSDYAKRDAALLTATSPIIWQSNLFLTAYDGGTTLTLYGGLQWGFEMKSATLGSSTGKFLNPRGPSPTKTVVNGAGTNQLDYGVGKPTLGYGSAITFTSTNFDPVPNEVFSVGKLTFSNYPTADGTEIDYLDLELSLNFTNVPEKNITLTTALTVVSTINSGNDLVDSDQVSLIVGDAIYTFYVPENTTSEVGLLGELTATPVITGISQDKSTDLFGDLVSDVIYNFNLVGFGEVEYGNGFVTTAKLPGTPLPGTVGLMALGLSLLAFRAKRPAGGK